MKRLCLYISDQAVKIIIVWLSLIPVKAVTTKAKADTWCVVNLHDASQQAYLVNGRMTITTSDNMLWLRSADIETSYDINRIRSYHFRDGSLTDDISQQNIPSDNVNVIFNTPDEVTITGMKANQTIRIFSTNGTQYPVNITSPFASTTADSSTHLNNPVTINLHSLPHGIYLITTPGYDMPAIKIIRK